MIIETNDNSMPFAFAYSEPEWSAVVATLPDLLVDAADLDAERAWLEYVATAYLNLTHHHRIRSANGFPTKAWKARRKRIARDLAEAEKDGNVDELPALREAFRRANVAVAGFALIGEAHQRRGDPARDWLYDVALAMWTRLGGTMEITRAEYGRAKPSGPVIAFTIAVLTPVMKDDTPGAEAIAKRIKKRRT